MVKMTTAQQAEQAFLRSDYVHAPSEPDRTPTWAELVEVEPRLLDVERRVLALHRDGQDDLRAWAEIKQLFMPLIGWSAEKYKLRTSKAYDVAYNHLLNCWETGRKPEKPR